MSYGEWKVRGTREAIAAAAVSDDLFEAQQGYAHGPERELLSALLLDGVQAFVAYLKARSPVDRRRFSEGYRWVLDLSSEHPFSFSDVCEALGLNPDYLRLGLRRASPAALGALERVRRTS